MPRAAEMQDLVKRWSESGLTQRAFVEKEGVSYSAFQYWRRRLRILSKNEAASSAMTLEPVRIVPGAPRPSSVFELRTAGGVSVTVAPGFDEAELRRLLGVLAEC